MLLQLLLSFQQKRGSGHIHLKQILQSEKDNKTDFLENYGYVSHCPASQLTQYIFSEMQSALFSVLYIIAFLDSLLNL